MSNQQKLYQLLQANGLQLTLADLIEYTYHEYSDQYLTPELANEHLNANLNEPLDYDTLEQFKAVIELGRTLYKDRVCSKS